MNFQYNAVRAMAVALLCFVMAACSQTATSTYGGGLGKKSVKSGDYRKAKIKAARARARKATIAKRKAFLAKRKKRLDARKTGSVRKSVKKSKRTARKRVKKKSIKRSARKRTKAKSRRVAAKRKNIKRKNARKNSRKKARRVASVGKKRRLKKRSSAFVPAVSRRAGRLTVRAPWKCVPKRLKRVIAQVRKRWGPVTINSTWRSRKKNRRVGGRKGSYHLHCNAVDFRVHGRTKGLTRWLSRHRLVGGYNRYPSGYYHIDTGPKRTW